jgi:hypothetical protein
LVLFTVISLSDDDECFLKPALMLFCRAGRPPLTLKVWGKGDDARPQTLPGSRQDLDGIRREHGMKFRNIRTQAIRTSFEPWLDAKIQSLLLWSDWMNCQSVTLAKLTH